MHIHRGDRNLDKWPKVSLYRMLGHLFLLTRKQSWLFRTKQKKKLWKMFLGSTVCVDVTLWTLRHHSHVYRGGPVCQAPAPSFLGVALCRPRPYGKATPPVRLPPAVLWMGKKSREVTCREHTVRHELVVGPLTTSHFSTSHCCFWARFWVKWLMTV